MGLCRNIITFLTFQPRDVPFCIHRPLRMRGFRIGGGGGGEFRFFLPKSPQNFDPSDKFFKGAHRERTLWISFFKERRHKSEGSDSGHLPGGGGANKKWNVPYMHHSWLLAGSGRVFSGSGKNTAGFGKNQTFLTRYGIWTLLGQWDSPNSWHGILTLF